MSVELSVITCSHNPRPDYLKQVLDALRGQTLDQQHWEYLLIDNASSEPLQTRVDLAGQPNARHIREDNLGLTHARLRGISESTGNLLVFVDDDNVLDADYLEQTTKIAEQWSLLGAFGGQVRAAFEEAPPEWTTKYWSRLVIREFDCDRWSNVPWLHETMPSGAGLCVRREVAAQYFEYHQTGKRKMIMDRAGKGLLSGGDTDLAATACDIGLGVGLFTTLTLAHLIPSDRLEEDYLVRLVEGMAFSSPLVNSFRSSGSPTISPTAKRRLADLARMALMDRRERRFFQAVRNGQRRAASFLENGG
jgi:glycosyltransferase involved in cell wall biosynthesis